MGINFVFVSFLEEFVKNECRCTWRWRSQSLQTSSFSALISVGPHSPPSQTPRRDCITLCFRMGKNSSRYRQLVAILSLLLQAELLSFLFFSMSTSRCVSDKTVSFVNASEGQSGRNGESSTIRYSFDMFRFTTEPHELFLHCTVQLCEPEDHESCKPVSLSHFADTTGICDTLFYVYSIIILGLIFVWTLVISLKIFDESENKRPAKPWNMLLINSISFSMCTCAHMEIVEPTVIKGRRICFVKRLKMCLCDWIMHCILWKFFFF